MSSKPLIAMWPITQAIKKGTPSTPAGRPRKSGSSIVAPTKTEKETIISRS